MEQLTVLHSIVRLALEAGFVTAGISKAVTPQADLDRLDQWLARGYQAGMAYMLCQKPLRADLNTVLPGVKSVVCLVATYGGKGKEEYREAKIARYARSEDYHRVLRRMAQPIVDYLQSVYDGCQCRVCVDSAPVNERSLAREAGVGWIGKNTCLIHPKAGSWLLLAEVLTTVELPTSESFTANYCGSCTRCIDACPTQALRPDGMLDAKRCISYLTIEHKEELPAIPQAQREKWVFGCDICQEVCPWNQQPPLTGQLPNPQVGQVILSPDDWAQMEKSEFKKKFADTALYRTGLDRIQRNVQWTGDVESRP